MRVSLDDTRKEEKVNKQILKGKIVAQDKNQKVLAEAMGLSLSRLNAKINKSSGAYFTPSEIAFIRDRYNLTEAEANAIFFDIQ